MEDRRFLFDVEFVENDHIIDAPEAFINAIAPRASVSKEGTVSTLVVTDREGVTSVEILDGEKGDKGDKGDPGDVNDVLVDNSSVVDSAGVAHIDAIPASIVTGQLTDLQIASAATWNAKQDAITSTNKLSSDLVDDTNKTNKFVTEADKTNWNNKVTKNADITAGTHTKITYDAKGLVTGGADLAVEDIPSIPLSKISDVTASATEVNYTFGVTSNIQTQLDSKQPNLPTTVSDKYLHTNSETGALEWADAGKIDDVWVNGTTVVDNKVAKVIAVQATDVTPGAVIPINADTLNGQLPSYYSHVEVSNSGTATDEVQYIKINGVEKKLAGGSGSDLPPYPQDTTKKYALGLKYENNNWVKYWAITEDPTSSLVGTGVVGSMIIV